MSLDRILIYLLISCSVLGILSDSGSEMVLKRNRGFNSFQPSYQFPVQWKSGRFRRNNPKYYNRNYNSKKAYYRKREKVGWTNWSQWYCPVTCGGGKAERIRYCNFAGSCEGPKLESRKCAETPCPEGAPPLLIDEAKRQISHTTRSFQVQKGESIKVECMGNMWRVINDYYRKAKGTWHHNQELFYPEKERIGIMDSFQLYIAKAWPKDNGVWYCETLLDPKTLKTAIYTAVYTVAVENDIPDMKVKVGKSFSMPCNNAQLSKFFSLKLVVEWYHNSSLYEKFEDLKPEEDQELAIKSSTFEDSGIWMCKVKEKDDKSGRIVREWTTNVVRVNVLDLAGSIFEEYSSVIVIIVFLILIVIGIIIYYCLRSKKKRARKKEYDPEKGSSKKSKDRKRNKTPDGRRKEALKQKQFTEPKKIAKKEVANTSKKSPKRDIGVKKDAKSKRPRKGRK